MKPLRIAFLCKRRYMGKDVIDDRYGRLYELPHQLARLGHDVHGFCLRYGDGAEEQTVDDAAPGHLTWHARATGPMALSVRGISYPLRILGELRRLKPDLLIGASDIPHVALTSWLARRLRTPYLVDLYDNFEGFGQARLPGFVGMLRAATRRADVVTTTSDALAELVRDTYMAKGKVVPMPSTVDLDRFRPGDKGAARHKLGLPLHASLVGTAGGLLANRGIGELYAAWKSIERNHPNAHLVLAGPVDPSCPPPTGPRVHYLGMLSHDDTAALFQALDVGVIYLRETTFGHYCFPQKAYEMFACGLPVVAANVGAMPGVLADLPDVLYAPQDAGDLTRAVGVQLEAGKKATTPIEDWQTIVGRLEPLLIDVARGPNGPIQNRGA